MNTVDGSKVEGQGFYASKLWGQTATKGVRSEIPFSRKTEEKAQDRQSSHPEEDEQGCQSEVQNPTTVISIRIC